MFSLSDLPWLPPASAEFSSQCKALKPDASGLGLAIRQLATSRLSAGQAANLSRAIRRAIASGADLSPLSPFRLGLLSGSTVDLLLDELPAAAARHGVALSTIAAPFDQVTQEAIDPQSATNAARLDAVLLAIDHRWLDLARPRLSGAAQALDDAATRISRIVQSLREHGKTSVILQTVPSPPQPLFGHLDRRVAGSGRALTQALIGRIVELADETGSAVLDVAALAERVGTDAWFDPVQWAAYKFAFASRFNAIYADMLGRLLGAMRGRARKCLVLDLDNTIWGGVIGDDGLEGISIGQGSPLGEAFLSVQHMAMDLRQRGILLAACSKNTESIARQAFAEHPDMALKQDHFAAFRANWDDKPGNLEAIARSLNIGLDALVLLDDNPAERAQVRATLPMVAVPELPQDPAWYPWFLTAAGYFESAAYSFEDTIRTETYAADSSRIQSALSASDVGEYLRSLDITMTVSPFDRQNRPRIAQLINKTNQFNLTTRRYTEAEVEKFDEDPHIYTLQARLKDRYGELGMIGVVVASEAEWAGTRCWNIDTWLMSCRVLGRKVEEAMLACIVADAKRCDVTWLIGTYIPTAKNEMVREHYPRLGFAPLDHTVSAVRYVLAVADYREPELPMKLVRDAAR